MESILQFLTQQFQKLLPVSLKAGLVILLVICVRMLLKRAPKIFSYALWSVVLFRLLCPVAFTAPVSVLDVVEPEQCAAAVAGTPLHRESCWCTSA